MPRLSGHHVQLGNAFQLAQHQDDHQERANVLLESAERQAQNIIDKAKQQARVLLDAANQKAAQIVAEGEAGKEAVLRQAYQEGEEAGYNKGYEEGYAQAEQETVRLLEGAQTVMEGAYLSKQRVLKGFRDSASAVISHLTTKVLNKTLELHPKLMIEMIDKAIESLHLTGRVKVVVSAEALENIKQFTARTDEALTQLTRFEFVPDPQLELSEIFITSQDGNFNLTPNAQIDALVKALTPELPINEVLAEEEDSEEEPEPYQEEDQNQHQQEDEPEESEESYQAEFMDIDVPEAGVSEVAEEIRNEPEISSEIDAQAAAAEIINAFEAQALTEAVPAHETSPATSDDAFTPIQFEDLHGESGESQETEETEKPAPRKITPASFEIISPSLEAQSQASETEESDTAFTPINFADLNSTSDDDESAPEQ